MSTVDADRSLYLHAELLPNIRQITLYVSLPRTKALDGVQPRIQLSESRNAVTVSLPEPFDDVAETIKLPARVSEASRRALSMTTTPATARKPPQSNSSSHDYSFRMQMDTSEQAQAPCNEVMDDYVPWTAADMSPLTRIRCRGCGAPFLGSPAPKSTSTSDRDKDKENDWMWKDLPSGNWAEMMDFWHCHKPDSHEEDPKPEASAALKLEEQNAQIKGYGASSHLKAIGGTVLIDVATFLLAESDCIGLRLTKSNEEEENPNPRTSGRTLECETCHAVIGMEDPSVSGWRLVKANVSLNTDQDLDTENPWQSHPIEFIVAAQLLELIERESARRFVIHCGQKTGVLLWVFNPDLHYSNSSSGHSVNAQQAMKVLFQHTEDVDKLLAPELGKVSPLSVEELELPQFIFQTILQDLRRSNEMLPLSARRFNEWNVGLLSRFSREKTKSA
ncbi:hypothetical protein N7532_001496 [Penicillium argentinense]|uniref:Ubiquitin-conjugating enzyme E2-binding protein n=1 Tax=Penicillium argentinense TaxID=1131581 RepID=A0A9W9G2U5_9EURO|nr:uncharacterized protein N7532_001496 [Penicillium argentinense]KAJ5110961.1 hypothetical protein N7532_001496 [Penicillium argentinense]